MIAAYLRLKNIYRLKRHLNSKQKYFLCNTLILSLFDYVDVVYGDCLSWMSKKTIQKLQNSCMRFAFNIPYRNHITPHLNRHKILNMNNRRNLHMYRFVYKIIKSGRPAYLVNRFQPLPGHHRTRNNATFLVPRHRTTAFRKSFTFVATKIWNGLTNEIKGASLFKYTNIIKTKLLEEQNLL